MSSASNGNPATRTPSPPSVVATGETRSNGFVGHGQSADVPSPVPASVSSTASSEPSSRPGSSSNLSQVYSMPSAPNSFTVPTAASGGAPVPTETTFAPAPGHPNSWGSTAYETGAPAPFPPGTATYPPPPTPAAHQDHYHPHYPPPPPPQGHHGNGPPAHQQHQMSGQPQYTSSQHQGAIPMVVSTTPHQATAPAPPPPAYYHQAPPPSQFQHSHAHSQQQQQQQPSSPVPSWACREDSCPNFSMGTNTEPAAAQSSATNKACPTASRSGATNKSRKKSATTKHSKSTPNLSNNSSEDAGDDTTGGGGGGGGVGDSVNSRRQKRLERNRESARLSRRRRKQYLEILEERVTQLSTEVDQGRRAHAAQAVAVTINKRREVLEDVTKTEEERIRLVENGLGRTSPEMMLVTTFKLQQLKSFALPPESKFILWLTLQNDQYFRGGRAASERLSAARIGERMLNSGNDRVPPAQSMWPLFCNEIGLSYDQEERVRNFQRTLLQNHDSWLQRHTAHAAGLTMAATHDSTQALSLRLGQRERSMMQVLTPAQKIKFLMWAEKNREKLKSVMERKVKKHMEADAKSPLIDDRFKIDKQQHVAGNLYILNYRLQKVMQIIPRAAPLVTGPLLRKLSRRPSFESLGRSPNDKPGNDGEGSMSRDTSFASSGSLKRSASALSMDGDRPQLLQISPDDAEETCKPTVEKILGHLKEIIPASPVRQYEAPPQPKNMAFQFRIPSPAHVSSAPYHQPMAPPPQAHYVQHTIYQLPVAPNGAVPMTVVSDQPAPAPENAPAHRKQSSFIPPHLNVVPEEMFPNDGTADEFLMSLVDEDWAIGEGIDMDTSNM